jgi:hypothetical protein
MPSSSCVEALLEPPNQLVTLPCEKCVRAHELENLVRLLPARLGPGLARRARMHERVQLARHEAIVDEEVLLDRETRIAALEVTGAIADDAMPQREVLRTGGRTDGVRLHEAEARDRPHQRGREQGAGDGVAAQVVEGWWLHSDLTIALRMRTGKSVLSAASDGASSNIFHRNLLG